MDENNRSTLWREIQHQSTRNTAIIYESNQTTGDDLIINSIILVDLKQLRNMPPVRIVLYESIFRFLPCHIP